MPLTVDIHGMTVIEAKIELNHTLDGVSDTVRELVVVHGYSHGSILLKFVRRQYRHKRVVKKMLTMNPGETVFILQPK